MTSTLQTANMDAIARADWKRHSAPYDFNFEIKKPSYPQMADLFDQAMEAFNENTYEQKTSTVGRERKKAIVSRLSVYEPRAAVELSTDQYTPGVLKIFGETILPGVQYKSVLASCRSTAQELVKQALERFGLSSEEYCKFVLCDVVGKYEGDNSVSFDNIDDTAKSGKWEQLHCRILSDKDKPLLLQKFWKPLEGFCRRYELHERASVVQTVEDDDTFGLNKNARKILMSKLRPGAIPMFDASKSSCYSNGLSMEYASLMRSDSSVTSFPDSTESDTGSERSTSHLENMKTTNISDSIPTKYPFFLNIRGYDVHKDKMLYPIRSKVFSIGTSHSPNSEMPHICLLAPDLTSIHCKFKVYRFKKSNGTQDDFAHTCNYFLEVETLGNDVSINGHPTSGKALIKSGDILCLGKFYMLMYKDCSKGFDIPLQLPWLADHQGASENEDYIQLDDMCRVDDEDKSNTDESMDVSIAERMSFAYCKDKEDELVKYICAIIQQQNTARTYSLSAAFLFSMCIEYASRKFERRQLKHLFLRILFTIRENVAESAKALSANKFTCTLLDSPSDSTRDQTLERLLLWISNCVQLLLFLKHTFQLPDPLPDHTLPEGKKTRGDRSPRKEDTAKHALGQLVTGLEEIIMFCFQQCVYTITKALYPTLPALLESNPFNDDNSEHCSMEDVTRKYETLAEVTHFVMLHEGITRQLFTYLFFFASTNIFNKLFFEESGKEYFSWSAGVRIRANLSHLEDWATQNGLEDEFSQMFERLLAASELLATSRNTLIKYPWSVMKDHYQPLTPGQLHHLLVHYQTGAKSVPANWLPPPDEMDDVSKESLDEIPLGTHPPFALPDNCGIIDLIRTPEDPTFWSHLRRLRTLYGVAEDDSDSGFSISNTPRCPSLTKQDSDETYFQQTASDSNSTSNSNSASPTRRGSQPEPIHPLLLDKQQRSRIPLKKSHTSPWSLKVPKSGTGVCDCSGIPPQTPKCEVIEGPGEDEDEEVGERIPEDSRFGDIEEIDPHEEGGDNLERKEGREDLESGERYNDSKDKVIAAIQSRSVKVNMCSVKSTEGSVKPLIQPRNVTRNVSNCSARKISPPSIPCHRSQSVTGDIIRRTNDVSSGFSYSMEDLSRRVVKHRPSASFEEAIERGYDSDTLPLTTKGKQNGHLKLSSIDEQNGVSHTSDSTLSSSKHTYQRQETTDSELSDEVFMGGSFSSSFRNIGISGSATLPPKNSFKPNGSSDFNTKQSNATSSVHQNHRSFQTSDSENSETSNLSLKMSKGRLLTGRNGLANGHVTNSSEMNGALPSDMLVEVNENILATKKRQCTSLNVVPLDKESPRPVHKALSQDVIDLEEHKKMSPCPLFTVYLRKSNEGLGLGLIDGLHTPLRLTGIYIKKILPDSPAAVNGCLQVGDRILAVCNKSVIGADYQSTMKLIRNAGDTLTLLVARGNESMAKKVTASSV